MICCCSYAISHSELIYFHWQGNLILQRTLIGERRTREIVNQAGCVCACACMLSAWTYELKPKLLSQMEEEALVAWSMRFPWLPWWCREAASQARMIQGLTRVFPT